MAEHISLKKGIKLSGNRAEEATTEELRAIHDMGTYEPLDASKLTREDKRDALESLLFVTEKRDGKIKSRKCAIGSKQRTYDSYDKSSGSSPTVTTKGLVMTCAVDTYEERDSAIADVGVTFLPKKGD